MLRFLLPTHTLFGAYLLLAALLLILALLPEPAQQWLQYDRSALETGQYWRLLSGHLLHSNGWHLLMNLAGLVLVMLLHGSYFRSYTLLLQWLLFAGVISGLLYLGSPQMHIYVGLSGMLHAMLTLGAIKDIQVKQHTGGLLLTGLIGKVVWEQWQGPDAALAELINASVAIDAHLYGVLSGLFIGIVLCVFSRSGKQ